MLSPGDASTPCANDDGNLAFVIQLRGFGRACQGGQVPDKRPGEPGKQRHVWRGVLPVFVFGIAVREINADTDDFFRGRDRNIPAECAVWMGNGTSGGTVQKRQSLCCDNLSQCRSLRDMRGQGDQVRIGDSAVVLMVVSGVGCKIHIVAPSSVITVWAMSTSAAVQSNCPTCIRITIAPATRVWVR